MVLAMTFSDFALSVSGISSNRQERPSLARALLRLPLYMEYRVGFVMTTMSRPTGMAFRNFPISSRRREPIIILYDLGPSLTLTVFDLMRQGFPLPRHARE